MKLTICIPTYNRLEYLKLLINDIEKNKSKNEIIIVDNNSNDGTFEYFSKYETNLLFKIIKNEKNIGFDENYYKCLEVAKTEYILILGDDERLKWGAINQIEKILEEKNIGGIIFSYDILKSDSEFDQKLEISSNLRDFCYQDDYKKVGFISTLLLNRELAISVDKGKINNNGYPHISIFLEIIETYKKNFLISDMKIVSFRNSNFKYSRENNTKRLKMDLDGYLSNIQRFKKKKSIEYINIFSSVYEKNIMSWMYQSIRSGAFIEVLKIIYLYRKEIILSRMISIILVRIVKCLKY